MKRLLLAALVLLLLVGCVPQYVKPYQPKTAADSVAVHADSVAWATQLQTRQVQGCMMSVGFALAWFVLLPAMRAR